MGREASQFKKGQSGNPKGGKRLPEAVKLLRKKTAHGLMATVCEVLEMTPDDLEDLKKSDNSKIPFIKLQLAKHLMTGEFKNLMELIYFVTGKPKELPEEVVRTEINVTDFSKDINQSFQDLQSQVPKTDIE